MWRPLSETDGGREREEKVVKELRQKLDPVEFLQKSVKSSKKIYSSKK